MAGRIAGDTEKMRQVFQGLEKAGKDTFGESLTAFNQQTSATLSDFNIDPIETPEDLHAAMDKFEAATKKHAKGTKEHDKAQTALEAARDASVNMDVVSNATFGMSVSQFSRTVKAGLDSNKSYADRLEELENKRRLIVTDLDKSNHSFEMAGLKFAEAANAIQSDDISKYGDSLVVFMKEARGYSSDQAAQAALDKMDAGQQRQVALEVAAKQANDARKAAAEQAGIMGVDVTGQLGAEIDPAALAAAAGDPDLQKDLLENIQGSMDKTSVALDAAQDPATKSAMYLKQIAAFFNDTVGSWLVGVMGALMPLAIMAAGLFKVWAIAKQTKAISDHIRMYTERFSKKAATKGSIYTKDYGLASLVKRMSLSQKRSSTSLTTKMAVGHGRIVSAVRMSAVRGMVGGRRKRRRRRGGRRGGGARSRRPARARQRAPRRQAPRRRSTGGGGKASKLFGGLMAADSASAMLGGPSLMGSVSGMLGDRGMAAMDTGMMATDMGIMAKDGAVATKGLVQGSKTLTVGAKATADAAKATTSASKVLSGAANTFGKVSLTATKLSLKTVAVTKHLTKGAKNLVTGSKTFTAASGALSKVTKPIAGAATKITGAAKNMVTGAKGLVTGAKVTGDAAKASSVVAKGGGMAAKVGAGIAGKAFAFLGPVLGAVTGVMESETAGTGLAQGKGVLGKVESGILGALSGGAGTTSMIGSMVGLEEGTAGNEAMGIAGGAATGALAGAAIGSVFPVIGTGIGAAVGGIAGAGASLYKILTKEDSPLRKSLVENFGSLSGVLTNIPGPLNSIMGGFNAMGKAADIFGVKQEDVTLGMKASAGAAGAATGVLNGLTFGIFKKQLGADGTWTKGIAGFLHGGTKILGKGLKIQTDIWKIGFKGIGTAASAGWKVLKGDFGGAIKDIGGHMKSTWGTVKGWFGFGKKDEKPKEEEEKKPAVQKAAEAAGVASAVAAQAAPANRRAETREQMALRAGTPMAGAAGDVGDLGAAGPSGTAAVMQEALDRANIAQSKMGSINQVGAAGTGAVGAVGSLAGVTGKSIKKSSKKLTEPLDESMREAGDKFSLLSGPLAMTLPLFGAFGPMFGGVAAASLLFGKSINDVSGKMAEGKGPFEALKGIAGNVFEKFGGFGSVLTNLVPGLGFLTDALTGTDKAAQAASEAQAHLGDETTAAEASTVCRTNDTRAVTPEAIPPGNGPRTENIVNKLRTERAGAASPEASVTASNLHGLEKGTNVTNESLDKIVGYFVQFLAFLETAEPHQQDPSIPAGDPRAKRPARGSLQSPSWRTGGYSGQPGKDVQSQIS